MTKGKKRGKVIWIVNTKCTKQQNIDFNEDQRIEKCRNNVDLDKTNMDMLLKHVGFDSKGNHIKDETAQKIKDFLKDRLEQVEKGTDHDSLIVMILSGKSECGAGKIYDRDGIEMIVEEEITKIICESEYFKGKPKIVIIQSYNFKDCAPCDELDAKVDNKMTVHGDPNTDDLFIVSSYPRIAQGPWMIGDNLSGSYFIQAFVHVFKEHAHDKSFLEILLEVHNHLVNAAVPKKEKEGKNTEETFTETKHVADVVVKQRGEKKLYFFPGYVPPVSDYGSVIDRPTS